MGTPDRAQHEYQFYIVATLMLGPLFVYGLFLWGCFESLRRPWIGLVVFYTFVVLEPTWNWRWSINVDFPYQKYISICILLGLFTSKVQRARLSGAPLWAFACLLGFLGISYLSALQTIHPRTTALYMDVLWKVILMAIVTVWLIDGPWKIWVALWVVVICQGYNAYQINLQYFEEGFSRFARTNWGTKGDNNVYSVYTLPIMGMAAALAAYGRVWWQYLLAGVMLVMQMHALMLMESRGAMLGGLVLAVIFIVLVPKSFRVWLTLIATVTCGGILAGPSVVEEFTSAFKPRGELDSSAESRYDVWRAGLLITKDYPLLGVGPNAGRFLVPRYNPNEPNRSERALHNLFLEISTGCGVPATVLYLSFFGIIFASCLALLMRQRRCMPDWAAAGCLAVICGVPSYWVGSMFSSGALLESSYLMIALGSATLLTYRRELELATEDLDDSEDEMEFEASA